MRRNVLVSVLAAVVGAVVVVGLFGFNRTHYLGDEYVVVNTAALLWAPVLLVLFVFREDVSGFGFAPGDLRAGMKLVGVLFALLLPCMLWASYRPEYRAYYPMDPSAERDLSGFLRFELIYGYYLFCWEFFFRGFLLFGVGKCLQQRSAPHDSGIGRYLHRWLGESWRLWPSVFAQAVPFGIMHYGKPEFAGSFLSGIVLGALAVRSKSFVPCFVLHWLISISFDVMVIVGKHGLSI